MPADCRWIKKNVRAAQARQPRSLRMPLVPAHQHADAGESRIEIRKSQVSWRKIKFFVIERIVRNVHLAIFAGERSVGVNRSGCIMINSGSTPLENRSDDNEN